MEDLKGVRIDDRGGEILGRLLRDVMADPVQDPVGVLAREHLPVRGPVLGRSVEIATNRDGWHADGWLGRQLGLDGVVAWFALGQPEPPPIVVYDDVDMVGVVEGAGRAVIGGVVEVPCR